MIKTEVMRIPRFPGDDFPDLFYRDIRIREHISREEEIQIVSIETNIYALIFSAKEGFNKSRKELSDACFSFYCIIEVISFFNLKFY